MRHDNIETITGRLFFIQAVAFLITTQAFALDNILEKFNPNYKINTRSPQSFYADVDFSPAPRKQESWLKYVFEEDNKGVMISMRDYYKNIRENDEYVTNWDLESTGLYRTSTKEERVAYFNRYIIKYLDKRISGEVKQAEEGSALAAVGNVQQALKPQTNVDISPNIKLKFKAQVLQGSAYVRIDNPYVEYKTTFDISGGINMEMRKEFKEIRSIASVDYNPKDQNYISQFDNLITDNLTARISSSQGQGNLIFSESSDSKLQLIYSSPFNY